MSDAKHTKGPWRLGEGGLPSKLNIWAAAAWQVAKVCRFTAADDAKQATHDAESEANARLIAAAPDLLEACKQAEALINNKYLTETFKPDIGVMLAKAIAKAEGK